MFLLLVSRLFGRVFCEFDAPWTSIKYRKEAAPNYCCVCTFVNKHSSLWLHKVKDSSLWLREFFVWINTDLIVTNSFGCLSDRKLLQNIELLSEAKLGLKKKKMASSSDQDLEVRRKTFKLCYEIIKIFLY